MNRTLAIHLSYLFVTVTAFVVGSAITRPGDQTAQTQQEVVGDLEASPATDSLELELLPSDAEQSFEIESNPASDLSPDTEAAGLSPEALKELVIGSIKSRSPVERRLAFDKILVGVHSKDFSVEQAMEIRKNMFLNGAHGSNWRLFDYAWGASYQDEAIAFLDEIPEKYFDGYLGNILPGLASSDPAAAIELFEGLEPEKQGGLRRRLYEGLIDNDVEVATNYIFESTNPKNFQWRPMDTLTRELVADKGLNDTLSWAQELPQAPLRGSAWSAAYAHWGATRPHEAVQQITEMPESPDRNQAINGFISAHAHRDGEAAVIWAAEITSPHMRQEAMLRAGRQYYRQDPKAATQWFNDSGLPESRWDQMVSR